MYYSVRRRRPPDGMGKGSVDGDGMMSGHPDPRRRRRRRRRSGKSPSDAGELCKAHDSVGMGAGLDDTRKAVGGEMGPGRVPDPRRRPPGTRTERTVSPGRLPDRGARRRRSLKWTRRWRASLRKEWKRGSHESFRRRQRDLVSLLHGE